MNNNKRVFIHKMRGLNMKSISKNIAFLAFFGALSCNASFFNFLKKNNNIVANEKIINELKLEFKKKHAATEADDQINNLVQKIAKECHITRPIIVLQTDKTDNSYTSSSPSVHPQEFMIIGTKNQSIDQITNTIYHEMGHIAHQDVSWKSAIKKTVYINSALGLMPLNGVAGAIGFYKYVYSSLILSVPVGLSCAATSAVFGVMALFYRERLKESKADAFAYEHLLKHKKLNTAIGMLADFLCKHENTPYKPLPEILSDYPSDLQRAKMGIEILQKYGYNIPNLMNNLPYDLDEGIRKKLPLAVKKFFPEYFSK